MVAEFTVVFFDRTHVGLAHKHVAVVHLDTQRTQSARHFHRVGYDGFVLVGQLGKEVAFDLAVGGEFDHLGVNEYKFEFGRMLGVEQRCNYAVQSDRFSLTCGAGDEKVRHLCQILDENIVGYGGPYSHRQPHFLTGVGKLLGAYDRADRHCLGVAVGHFDADSAGSGNRRDDAYAQRCEAEGNIVFETLDLCDADTFGRNYLVERDCRADSGLDALDRYSIVK